MAGTVITQVVLRHTNLCSSYYPHEGAILYEEKQDIFVDLFISTSLLN